MLKTIVVEPDKVVVETVERSPSIGWALASLSLSMLLSSLDTSIANVALPTLAQAFGAPFREAQWVVLANLLALTTLIVSVGRLGDIIGRRRLLLVGIFLFTVASVLSGVAPTLGLLITARAAQGVGGAIMMALTMAMVGETVPKAKTGSAMGLLGTMTVVGLIGMGTGAIILSLMPATLGIAGFVVPIVVITAGYGLFQTANNTAVMNDLRPDQRGSISGLLNLSRNLGRITGASVMGAVFAFASATTEITTALPEAVATGMQTTFAVAAILIVFALALAVGSRALATRYSFREEVA